MRLIRRMAIISSGDGIHIQILRKRSEHGSRIASLHQEEEVVVHLLIVHVLNGIHKLLVTNSSTSNKNSTRTSMRSEIEHDIVIRSRMKSTRFTLSGQLSQLINISSHDSQHNLRLHVLRLVINVLNTTVSIILTRSRRTIISEQFSREGIGGGIRNLAGTHQDNILRLHTSSDKILVHTATLGLHTVIRPISSRSNNDGMSISKSNRQQSKEENSRVLHLQIFCALSKDDVAHQFLVLPIIYSMFFPPFRGEKCILSDDIMTLGMVGLGFPCVFDFLWIGK